MLRLNSGLKSVGAFARLCEITFDTGMRAVTISGFGTSVGRRPAIDGKTEDGMVPGVKNSSTSAKPSASASSSSSWVEVSLSFRAGKGDGVDREDNGARVGISSGVSARTELMSRFTLTSHELNLLVNLIRPFRLLLIELASVTFSHGVVAQARVSHSASFGASSNASSSSASDSIVDPDPRER